MGTWRLVRTADGSLSEEFRVERGVVQGRVLSPLLFQCFMDKILKRDSGDNPRRMEYWVYHQWWTVPDIERKTPTTTDIHNVQYEDDLTIVAESPTGGEKWEELQGRWGGKQTAEEGNHSVPDVEEEVEVWVGIPRCVCVFQVMIMSVLRYETEISWAVTQQDLRRWHAFLMKCLQDTVGVTLWHKIRNACSSTTRLPAPNTTTNLCVQHCAIAPLQSTSVMQPHLYKG